MRRASCYERVAALVAVLGCATVHEARGNQKQLEPVPKRLQTGGAAPLPEAVRDVDVVGRLLNRADEIAALAHVGTAAGHPRDVRELARRTERRARSIARRLDRYAESRGLGVVRAPVNENDVGIVALRRAEGQLFVSSFLSELTARLTEAASFAEASRPTVHEPALSGLLVALSRDLTVGRDLSRRVLRTRGKTAPAAALSPLPRDGRRPDRN